MQPRHVLRWRSCTTEVPVGSTTTRRRSNMRRLSLMRSTLLILPTLLTACSLFHHDQPFKTPDDEPTIKSLAGRTVEVKPDSGIATNQAQAIQAYQSFLDTAKESPQAPERAEAMRRIG